MDSKRYTTCFAAFLAASIAALMLIGGSAHAASMLLTPPKSKLTYKVVGKGVADEARFAASAWNRARVPFRFVRKRGAGAPDIVIGRSSGSCSDYGGVSSYTPYNPAITPMQVKVTRCGSQSLRNAATVRSFGGLLGMKISRKRCRLMFSVTTACTPSRPSAADQREVRRLAAKRNKAHRKAPSKATIDIAANLRSDSPVDEPVFDPVTQEYTSSPYSIGVTFRLTASWNHFVWTSAEIVITNGASTWKDDANIFSGELGPYFGASWSADGGNVFYNMNPGTYTITGLATELNGHVLRSAPLTFTIPS